MWYRLLTRLVSSFAMLVAMLIITVLLLRVAPGRPGEDLHQLGRDVQDNQSRRLGTDRSTRETLGDTLGSWMRGDFGRSLVRGEAVTVLIGRTWPVTLSIGLHALFLAVLLGIGGGLAAGLRSRGLLSRALPIAALILVSVSVLGVGSLTRMTLTRAERFSLGGWDEPLDHLLPALVLGLVYGAWLLEVVRSSTVMALRAPWVLGARARGLSPARVVVAHVLPTALIPVLEAMGPVVARLLTGSFVVEVLFEVPGISRTFMEATAARDYPVIIGVVMVYTATVTVLQAGLELAHELLDPRLRGGGTP
ncbi:MAG: ABC transporter permease [Deltaproteobacteria bacterium]|nr:ABC transporter permease [Deltaproteobacteria bacterium]